METLLAVELPKRGIHIHAYNGSVELIPELVALGAYFSFNAGQLKPGKSKVSERIRAVPQDRLLIETDAPDFLPPEQFREFELDAPQLCHPANLRASYRAIAEVRDISYDALAEQVEANFMHYFG
jgi:TatD DNase family protein